MQKPALVYDGECGFCRRWVYKAASLTTGLHYYPSKSPAVIHPSLTEADFKYAVYYIREDDTYCYGADAAFKVMSHMGLGLFAWCFRFIPGLKFFLRFFYRFVSARRPFFSKVSKFFYGSTFEPSTHFNVRPYFLRGLGFIYLCAFGSLWLQVKGLYGAKGILPIADYLTYVHRLLGAEAFFKVPSLLWLSSSDLALSVLCGLGILGAGLVVVGTATRLGLIVAWLSYLSFVSVGQDFLSFQWDVLLLEVGFLSLFLTSRSKLLCGFAHWMLCWTLFRVLFASGLVKLMSGDSSWWDGTAMTYHYWTQPLPHIGGWLMYQTPIWFHKASGAMLFFIELGVAWAILLPRRLRGWGFWPLVIFQGLIMLTGNYGFFNLLVICLCVLILTDRQLTSFFRVPFPKEATLSLKEVEGLVGHSLQDEMATLPIRKQEELAELSDPVWRARWKRGFTIFCAGLLGYLFLVSCSLESKRFLKKDYLSWVWSSYEPIRQTCLANGYGLFAIMTKTRLELSIEGSEDGITWKTYGFKYKPQDPSQMPRWVQPHHPRLDWQFWFASLQAPEMPNWVRGLGNGIAENNPDVLALLGENPFPNSAPKLLRITAKDYRFSDNKTFKEEGLYWKVGPPVLNR